MCDEHRPGRIQAWTNTGLEQGVARVARVCDLRSPMSINLRSRPIRAAAVRQASMTSIKVLAIQQLVVSFQCQCVWPGCVSGFVSVVVWVCVCVSVCPCVCEPVCVSVIVRVCVSVCVSV